MGLLKPLPHGPRRLPLRVCPLHPIQGRFKLADIFKLQCSVKQCPQHILFLNFLTCTATCCGIRLNFAISNSMTIFRIPVTSPSSRPFSMAISIISSILISSQILVIRSLLSSLLDMIKVAASSLSENILALRSSIPKRITCLEYHASKTSSRVLAVKILSAHLSMFFWLTD